MNHYHSLLFLLILTLPGCASDHYSVDKNGVVDLYLKHDEAQEVVFVSSIDDFQKHQLRKNSRGLWIMEGLTEEEFRYFYLVDNTLYLPLCRHREDDDFGGQSCIHQP